MTEPQPWVGFKIWRDGFHFGMGIVFRAEAHLHNLQALSEDECDCRPGIDTLEAATRDGVLVSHRQVL